MGPGACLAPLHPDAGLPGRNPLIISRGEGIYLYDLQGNRYLDGVSSLWANLHGHRRRELDQALAAQLSQLAHSTLLGIAHPPAILLARRLAELAPPGLNKVFFSDNGSTAVEAALKMAFQCWRNRGQRLKQRFLKLSGAYHGDTLGAVSVGGIPLFHEIYQPLSVRHPGGPGPLLLPVRPPGRLPGAMSRPAGRAGGGAPPGTGGGDRGAGDAGRRGHDCPAARLSGEGKGGDPAPRRAPHRR